MDGYDELLKGMAAINHTEEMGQHFTLDLKENLAMRMLGLALAALTKRLEQANPEEFARYGRNKCRQGAFICKALLDDLLPSYRWTIYEGTFKEEVGGKPQSYEHAYVFGSGGGAHHRQRIICDLTRTLHPNLFIKVSRNSYEGLSGYKGMRRTKLIPLDFEEMCEETEYFTKVKGSELVTLIKGDVGKVLKEGDLK